MNKDIAFKDLSSVLGDLDKNQIEIFLKEILTESEKDDIARRWAILNDIATCTPQRIIAENYKSSLCKITRCSSIFKSKGLIYHLLSTRYDETHK